VDKSKNINQFNEIDPSGKQSCQILLYKNPNFEQEKSSIASVNYPEHEITIKQMENYSDGYSI